MWSIIMEPGKQYSTVVENTFHLSMATLDLETVKKADDVHTVYVETNDNPRVILCHLSKASKVFQCRLDHIFSRGTELKFVTSATANIHMTGYLDLSEEDDLYSDLETESDEEETPITQKTKPAKDNKRKAEDNFSKKSKAIKLDESNQSNEDIGDSDSDDEIMDFEDSEDDDDENEGVDISDLLDDEADSDDDDDDDEDDNDDDDDDDDDEDDDSDEIEDAPVLTKKTKEQQQKTPKKQLNGNEQKTPKKEQKTPKGQEKTPKGQDKTPKAQEKTPKGQKTTEANQSLINGSTESNKKQKNKEPKTPVSGLKTKPDTPLPKDKPNQPQKLNGGVVINDLKVGDGAVAKPGKNVRVYYVGRLKSTGKVFDSMQKGPGFSFGLQRGEVIKGWDVGIVGMKVGGKRKVICPPNMAYGPKGSPPEIPPNSTLVFEVELKHVN